MNGKDPYQRSNDGVTKIGDSLGAGWEQEAERAWKAQQAFLATPEGQEQLAAENQERAAESRDEQVRAYTSRGIPVGAAISLLDGVDPHGKRLMQPDFEVEMLEAFESGARVVVLLGKVGRGKTTSACRWLEAHPDGIYLTAEKLVSLSPRMSDDRPQLEGWKMAPYAVLDEVGTEGEKQSPKVQDFLHHRYEWQLPTLVIANMAPKQFLEGYGERIARRVFALGRRIVASDILCPGERRRQRGKQERLV